MKGWFRTSRQPTKGGTHIRAVALTAYEIASAMAYIHSHGVLHLVRARCMLRDGDSIPAAAICDAVGRVLGPAEQAWRAFLCCYMLVHVVLGIFNVLS